MLDDARVDHLRDEIGCSLAGFVLLLDSHQSLLEFMDLLNPRFVLRFLLSGRLLVGFDLGDSSSSLARNLEHVGGLALGYYKIQ